MSSAPVMSVTDELVAELEALAKSAEGHCGKWVVYIPDDYIGPNDLPGYGIEDSEGRAIVWGALEPETGLRLDHHAEFIAAANPCTMLALLSERAEMKQQLRAAMISVDNCDLFRKDAERYQWLLERGDSAQWMNILRVDPDDFGNLSDAIDAAMQAEASK